MTTIAHTRPRRILPLALTALGLAGGLAACGGSGEGSATAASAGRPQSGGSIVYGTDREPTCLDPHSLGDMPQTYVARQYLDSLVSMRPDGSVVPWLADAWEVSDDGLVYTFRLRRGVRFTDGEPFDAAAVRANFDQILDPATQSTTDLVYLKSYYRTTNVVDEHTVQIVLRRPYSPLLQALSQAFFGIESPKAMARGLKVNCQSPVGTGPFKVERWDKGQAIHLVRNPDHTSWPADAKHRGPAYLDRITWRILKDSSVRWSALQSGEAQVIFNIPPEHQRSAEADQNIELQEFVHSGKPFSFALNTTRAPFDDLRVRQAFLYGSNAKDAVRSAYLDVFPYSGGPLMSGTPYYDDRFEDAYPHDPQKANELLDAAGWDSRDGEGYRVKDGRTLTVRLPYSGDPGDTPPADVTLFQNIQAALKEVGFKLVLQPQSLNEFYASFADTKAYEAITTYWNSPTTAVLYIVYSTQSLTTDPFSNVSKVSDRRLDDILLRAAATTDREQQRDLYGQAQQIVSDNAWQLSLYPIQTRLGIRKELKDVWIEPSEGEPVLHDAWLQR